MMMMMIIIIIVSDALPHQPLPISIVSIYVCIHTSRIYHPRIHLASLRKNINTPKELRRSALRHTRGSDDYVVRLT